MIRGTGIAMHVHAGDLSGSWKDHAYYEIPRDHLLTRLYWLQMNEIEEAAKGKKALDIQEAFTLAVAKVHEEDVAAPLLYVDHRRRRADLEGPL